MPGEARSRLLVPPLKDRYPEYFIYGPIVFSSATQEYVASLGGAGIAYAGGARQPAAASGCTTRPPSRASKSCIIATRMFPHPITKGYDNRPLGVIGKMNGEEVKNLRHLAELLRDCNDEFVRFEMADRSESLVFRREEIARRRPSEILTDEGIRYQASESLRDVWKD